MKKGMWKCLASAMICSLMLMPNSAAAYYYSGSWWNGYNTSYARSTASATPVMTNTAQSYRPTAAAPATRTSTTANTAGNSVEQTLFSLLNQERSKYGLLPLQTDATLSSLARMKSQDMVSRRYFSHTSPTYGTPAQMLSRNGVRYTQYGENIAQGGDAYRIHAMWMASPEHRANILRASFTHAGIGVAPDDAGYTATQLFIAR